MNKSLEVSSSAKPLVPDTLFDPPSLRKEVKDRVRFETLSPELRDVEA